MTLPVEEGETSLLSSNSQHWVGLGPADVGGHILVRGKLDVLELSLAHRPNRNDMRGRQNSERIIVLVPCKIINPRSLVARKLEHRLSLPIHDPNDLIVSTNSDQIAIMTPGRLASAIAQLIRCVFEYLLYLTVVNHSLFLFL